MGIYTSNRYFGREVPDYASQIPANEAYDAAFGCAHILADCQANDMALFESSIYSDMQEVMSIQEGYQVVNENAFTDVLKKIGEMFKKLIAKIKGIFKAFIAKLGGFAKDGKDLVKKYEKQILKYSNWKQFKIKIRKPKNNNTDIVAAINKVFNVDSNGYNVKTNTRYKINFKESGSSITDEDKVYDSGLANLDTPKKVREADADDIKEKILNTYVNGPKLGDYKEFSEDITEYLYDEEDTLDGDDDNVSSSTFTSSWVKGVLMETKLISDAEKMNKNLEKFINGIIDDINKTQENLTKGQTKEDPYYAKKGSDENYDFGGDVKIGKNYHRDKKDFDFEKGSAATADVYTPKTGKIGRNDTKKLATDVKANDGNWYASTDVDKTNGSAQDGVDATILQKGIQAMQKIASNEQEVVSKVTSEYMAQLKFALAQAKKMWTSAAAYSSTEHKEHYSYYNALGDAYAEQVYMNFEAIRG